MGIPVRGKPPRRLGAPEGKIAKFERPRRLSLGRMSTNSAAGSSNTEAESAPKNSWGPPGANSTHPKRRTPHPTSWPVGSLRMSFVGFRISHMGELGTVRRPQGRGRRADRREKRLRISPYFRMPLFGRKHARAGVFIIRSAKE